MTSAARLRLRPNGAGQDEETRRPCASEKSSTKTSPSHSRLGRIFSRHFTTEIRRCTMLLSPHAKCYARSPSTPHSGVENDGQTLHL